MLHWFNPENDLALASGKANYTPPQAGRLIAECGALLPMWYAHPDDSVLCSERDEEWVDTLDLDIKLPKLCTKASADSVADPWGWSAYAKKSLLKAGIRADNLPSDESIQQMRQLSHRRTSRQLALFVKEALGWDKLASPAEEARTEAELRTLLASTGDAYLKAPWSSSGRGVLCTKSLSADRAIKFGMDSIRRQGSVMVEKAHDKAIDFAKIFECREGKCICLGSSVFATDPKGAYLGNLLANEERRLRHIEKHYSLERLSIITETLLQGIETIIAPYYTGILGVDMLVDRKGLLEPVVEVNLRKTMGYVALRFAQLHMQEDAVATFRCVPFSDFDKFFNHFWPFNMHFLTPPNQAFTFCVLTQNA